MRIEYIYKLQGDGRDSWQANEYDNNDSLCNSYMVYAPPTLKDGDTLDNTDLPMDRQLLISIESENIKYIKRKADGEAYHLYVCAKLRVAKLAGGITQNQYDAVYEATKNVRAEIVNGQWQTGLKELEKLDGYLSGSLYTELHTYISNYVNESYN